MRCVEHIKQQTLAGFHQLYSNTKYLQTSHWLKSQKKNIRIKFIVLFQILRTKRVIGCTVCNALNYNQRTKNEQ